MIADQAQQIVRRLQQLKSGNNQNSKRLNSLSQGINEYRQKILKYMQSLDQKIIQQQQQIDCYQEAQGENTIKNIQNFEFNLKKLVNSYSNQSALAHQKLNKMLQSVKMDMQASFQQDVASQKKAIQHYKTLSSRLETLIDYVRQKQKACYDRFDKLQDQIQILSDQISRSNQQMAYEMQNSYEEIQIKIAKLANGFNQQLNQFMVKKEKKFIELQKIIYIMLNKAVQQ